MDEEITKQKVNIPERVPGWLEEGFWEVWRAELPLKNLGKPSVGETEIWESRQWMGELQASDSEQGGPSPRDNS